MPPPAPSRFSGTAAPSATSRASSVRARRPCIRLLACLHQRRRRSAQLRRSRSIQHQPARTHPVAQRFNAQQGVAGLVPRAFPDLGKRVPIHLSRIHLLLLSVPERRAVWHERRRSTPIGAHRLLVHAPHPAKACSSCHGPETTRVRSAEMRVQSLYENTATQSAARADNSLDARSWPTPPAASRSFPGPAAY